jgi:hypothetical protein
MSAKDVTRELLASATHRQEVVQFIESESTLRVVWDR